MTAATDTPTVTRKVTSREFDIVYDVVGDGPTVVLYPGIFMERVRWRETGTLDALRDRYRLIAIDPLGFGDSSKPTDPGVHRADLTVQDTLAVLDAEGVERAHLWGYSRGAGLAADVAALHPERAHSVVLGGFPVLMPRSALPASTESLAALRAGDWERMWANFPVPIPQDVKDTMQRRNDPVAAAAAWEGLVGDLDPERLTCPAMFYVGGGEWFWEVVRDEAESIGARLEVIGDLDHAGTFQATDTVVPLVDDFLRGIA